jgi:hypothetical protein
MIKEEVSLAIVVRDTHHLGQYRFEVCLVANPNIKSIGKTEEEAIASLKKNIIEYHRSKIVDKVKIVMMNFNEMLVEEVMEE